MKVLFAGPSLYRSDLNLGAMGIVARGPAIQGDVARAVVQGAAAIGIVDGLYETVAAVWHKEILYALSEGVRVFGAASLGALRAAECHGFGMIGIGTVFGMYASGALDDDAAVAQLHAPADFDHAPLSEALVNIAATIDVLAECGAVNASAAATLHAAAASLHFKDRTIRKIVDLAWQNSAELPDDIMRLFKRYRVDLKHRDASLLVDALRMAPESRGPKPNWQLSTTQLLDSTIAHAKKGD